MIEERMRVRKSIIYRFILFAYTISLVISLCGCDIWSSIDESLRENKRKSDDKYWTDRNVPPVDLDLEITFEGKESSFNVDSRVSRCVYSYLEDGDKKKLKKMFAQSVIDDYDDLGSDLDELIEFYDELEIDGYEIESNSMYKVYRRNPRESIVEYVYHTKFKYDGDRYELDILFVRESTRDDDLLGVHGIRIRNRDTGDSVLVNTINRDID